MSAEAAASNASNAKAGKKTNVEVKMAGVGQYTARVLSSNASGSDASERGKQEASSPTASERGLGGNSAFTPTGLSEGGRRKHSHKCAHKHKRTHRAHKHSHKRAHKRTHRKQRTHTRTRR